MQSSEVLMILGTLLLHASSNGKKYLSALLLVGGPGEGRTADEEVEPLVK